jgi:hypothetical protein
MDGKSSQQSAQYSNWVAMLSLSIPLYSPGFQFCTGHTVAPILTPPPPNSTDFLLIVFRFNGHNLVDPGSMMECRSFTIHWAPVWIRRMRSPFLPLRTRLSIVATVLLSFLSSSRNAEPFPRLSALNSPIQGRSHYWTTGHFGFSRLSVLSCIRIFNWYGFAHRELLNRAYQFISLTMLR